MPRRERLLAQYYFFYTADRHFDCVCSVDVLARRTALYSNLTRRSSPPYGFRRKLEVCTVVTMSHVHYSKRWRRETWLKLLVEQFLHDTTVIIYRVRFRHSMINTSFYYGIGVCNTYYYFIINNTKYYYTDVTRCHTQYTRCSINNSSIHTFLQYVLSSTIRVHRVNSVQACRRIITYSLLII